MVLAAITCWLMSAVGVRSCTATDSESSINDAYSSTSNRNTFLGRFMACLMSYFLVLFPGELQPHLAIAVGIVAPILAYFHEQEQMHGNAQDFSDLLARIRADRLDCGATLAEYDLTLAFALDKDGLFDADRMVLALGPAIGLDGGLIRQFLVKFSIDLFPGDFGRELAHRRVRHLVFGIEERPGRQHLAERGAEVVDAIPGQRRHHEGLC